MNFKNSEISDPPRLLLNLKDKINVRTKDKHIAFSNLSIYYTSKISKSNLRAINSQYQLQHGMKILNCLMDHILYLIFKIILNIY